MKKKKLKQIVKKLTSQLEQDREAFFKIAEQFEETSTKSERVRYAQSARFMMHRVDSLLQGER